MPDPTHLVDDDAPLERERPRRRHRVQVAAAGARPGGRAHGVDAVGRRVRDGDRVARAEAAPAPGAAGGVELDRHPPLVWERPVDDDHLPVEPADDRPAVGGSTDVEDDGLPRRTGTCAGTVTGGRPVTVAPARRGHRSAPSARRTAQTEMRTTTTVKGTPMTMRATPRAPVESWA